jgi:ABC-2 type transport system permease protein
MSLMRLEVLRLMRTSRWLILAAVYVAFGLMGPVAARYMKELLDLAGGSTQGITIEFPDPVPADGMIQYVNNAIQVGTLVTIIVAAGALAFDSIAEMGVFLRTRVPNVWQILAPRLLVPFLAASTVFVLGSLAAWYETSILLGPLDSGSVFSGIALGILFLAFVVAVVSAVAQWARTMLATVMVSLIVLVTLPIVGIADIIGRWLPTRLGTALAELVGDASPGDFIGPAAVAIVSIPLLIWLAIVGARRREA